MPKTPRHPFVEFQSRCDEAIANLTALRRLAEEFVPTFAPKSLSSPKPDYRKLSLVRKQKRAAVVAVYSKFEPGANLSPVTVAALLDSVYPSWTRPTKRADLKIRRAAELLYNLKLMGVVENANRPGRIGAGYRLVQK